MSTDDLLNAFLDRWQLDDIRNMALDEYVDIGNKDTFCQWVETKTRSLGSIKGLTSIKFGIYKRKDSSKKPKNYKNGEVYSWLKAYGEIRSKAFQNVKKDLIRIIEYSQKGRFDLIDEIILPDLFKWKVAFLYSNERLIPIYKRTVLKKIANHFELETDRNLRVSKIQNAMISNKPANLNVYEYMWDLFGHFGNGKERETINDTKKLFKRIKQTKRKRRGSIGRNTERQFRVGARSYIAEQKHNIIQEQLQKHLVECYGADNVIMEENFVDVKLIQKDYLGFYEVKSSSYASECIKEALGQILLYTHYDEDKRTKKVYVVGQYPATEHDRKYIDFIKANLNLEFEYLDISIE